MAAKHTSNVVLVLSSALSCTNKTQFKYTVVHKNMPLLFFE